MSDFTFYPRNPHRYMKGIKSALSSQSDPTGKPPIDTSFEDCCLVATVNGYKTKICVNGLVTTVTTTKTGSSNEIATTVTAIADTLKTTVSTVCNSETTTNVITIDGNMDFVGDGKTLKTKDFYTQQESLDIFVDLIEFVGLLIAEGVVFGAFAAMLYLIARYQEDKNATFRPLSIKIGTVNTYSGRNLDNENTKLTTNISGNTIKLSFDMRRGKKGGTGKAGRCIRGA